MTVANFKKKSNLDIYCSDSFFFFDLVYGFIIRWFIFEIRVMSQRYRVLKILSFLIVVARLFLYINSSRNKDENAFSFNYISFRIR